MNDPAQLILADTTGLTPDMFTVEGHKFIYMSMLYLLKKGQDLDPISIMNVYTSEKAKGAIEELGGIEYIESIKNFPAAPNTGLFVEHIKQASARRDMYRKAEEIQQAALKDQDKPLEEILSETEEKFRQLTLMYQINEQVVKVGTGIGSRLKERALKPKDVIGLKTGWAKFDLACHGLVDGELTIVGARSKVGKSTVLLNWCKKLAVDDGVPILYIDTEMYTEEQEDKLISIISGVPHDEIRSGMYGQDTINGYAKDKIKAVAEAAKKLSNAPLYHIYLPNFTPEKIQALARQYKLEHGVRLIVFDYIKLPSSNSNLGDKEYQALGYLTSSLKDLAGILQVPVISAVQLNRGAVAKGKSGEDLDEGDIAGSDRILQIANRVCFLRKATEEEYSFNGATHMFKIGVQRMGKPLGWTPVKSGQENWRMEMVS
ncbi:replicative DNA helicase [Bacillus phage 056SW001B]|uniref:DNA 5'-3' helicase n=1 Tax=Bacillus phage 056SW001B TaxID=2601663 RepID=A0A5P8PIJ1_9CAUD|nr:replicative DNA helicase [Bacillus phage 056SW001B]